MESVCFSSHGISVHQAKLFLFISSVQTQLTRLGFSEIQVNFFLLKGYVERKNKLGETSVLGNSRMSTNKQEPLCTMQGSEQTQIHYACKGTCP